MTQSNNVYAHCDGPCGVYDPSSARIAAEAVLSMTKKLLDLKAPDTDKEQALLAYHNTVTRYVAIKEKEAEKCRKELLILWTDFFKEEHLGDNPDLHTVFWNAAKLTSACKHYVRLEDAEQLMSSVEAIHKIFWKAKGKDVPWITAA